jgi:hypothetical protein
MEAMLAQGNDFDLAGRQGLGKNHEVDVLVAAGEGLMSTIPATLAEPILVAKLPLPPDVAEEVATILKERPRRDRVAVEEDIKLRYHYAGHFVITSVGRHGLQIHAVDLENPEEIAELQKRMEAQGYRQIFCLFPTPWRHSEDQALTFML